MVAEKKGRNHNGTVTEYYENGLIWFKAIYEKGNLIDILDYNQLDGKKIDWSNFKQGNGNLKIFNSCGEYEGIAIYKNGKIAK